MRKELVVSVSDLRYVSIECRHCGTRVVLDMQRKEPAEVRSYSGSAPAACPGCEVPYDSGTKPAVDGLRKAVQSLMQIPDRVTLRGEPTE